MSGRYRCDSCDRNVDYKNRGFWFFMIWPWSMIFMKKRCPICNSRVVKK